VRPGLVDGVLLALTIACVVLLACFYVSRERFFYYWEYAPLLNTLCLLVLAGPAVRCA